MPHRRSPMPGPNSNYSPLDRRIRQPTLATVPSAHAMPRVAIGEGTIVWPTTCTARGRRCAVRSLRHRIFEGSLRARWCSSHGGHGSHWNRCWRNGTLRASSQPTTDDVSMCTRTHGCWFGIGQQRCACRRAVAQPADVGCQRL